MNDAPQFPAGVHAPEGVDADALADSIVAAARRPDEPTMEHLERLARIARMGLAAGLSNGVVPTLQRMADLIDSLMEDVAGVSIIVHDAVDRSFVTSASTVAGQVSGHSASRVRSTGATRFIVDNVVGISVREVGEDPFGANQMLRESGMRSYVGLPIVANGVAIAALYAMSQRPDRFGPHDIELLRVVADRAAMVLVAAQEHERVIRIARHSQALSLATRQVAATMGDTVPAEAVLAQLAMSVDFDLLVMEVSHDAPMGLDPVVVGRSAALREAYDAGGRPAVRALLPEPSRLVTISDGALAGVQFLAVRDRAPLDARDEETLRTVASVLAIPFRRGPGRE